MNSKDLLQLYNGQLQEFELAKKNYTDLQQAVYRDIHSIFFVSGSSIIQPE